MIHQFHFELSGTFPVVKNNYLQLVIMFLIKNIYQIITIIKGIISTSPLTGKRVNNNKKSSVKDHCLLSGHVCSFEDFSVLNYESHKFKRLIKESLLVTKETSIEQTVQLLKLELFWFNYTYAIFTISQMIVII